MAEFLIWIIFSVPAILLASTVHEYAHAWSAYKLGDVTAKAEGRMTLNPLVHIDPIGAILLIVAKFGWSKPVPINEYNFNNPVLGTAITAAAGPFSNLILTMIFALIYNLLPDSSGLLGTFIYVCITINLSLMIFNLIPIPPLDGHKIVRAILPKDIRYYWESLEKYAIWILLLIFIPFSPLSTFTSSFIIGTMNLVLDVLNLPTF